MSRLGSIDKQGYKSRKCGDCYWLTQQYEGSACEDSGQLASATACQAFEFKDATAWILEVPVVRALKQTLREDRLKIPKLIKAEIGDIEQTIGSLALPKTVSTQQMGKRLQRGLSEAAAYRSRLTELLGKMARVRGGLLMERVRVESELLLLGPVRALKTKNEKDVILSVGCYQIDVRLMEIDTLMDNCRELIRACETVRSSADIIVRAIYATRDPV